MDGVTVIKKEEIFERESGLLYVSTWGMVVTITLLVFFASVISYKALGTPHFVVTIFGALTSLINSGFFIFVLYVEKRAKKIPTGEYQYIVNIAPEVSFTELTEKYEVTKNNDETYTLKEK